MTWFTWSAGASRRSASRRHRSPTKPSSRHAGSACRAPAWSTFPHPVQLLTGDELDARADAIFPDVLAALTGGESDRSPGGAA
jgi:hypothetical protein